VSNERTETETETEAKTEAETEKEGFMLRTMFAAILALGVLSCSATAAPGAEAFAKAAQAREPAGPQILVPRDGQRIGDGDEPLCPKAPDPCRQIQAEGRVPRGLTPFFGVEPIKASPAIWIQPAIHAVREDGSFSGLVYLGESQHAGETFKIYLFACQDRDRFREGEQIRRLPQDCTTSQPVTVTRAR
jgi:hypothetical protein